jgi:hypothetical protein
VCGSAVLCKHDARALQSLSYGTAGCQAGEHCVPAANCNYLLHAWGGGGLNPSHTVGDITAR